MRPSYTIQKKWGETPLEALERLREDEQILHDVPMTYAGRLDPAAEGELIILTGDECKKKEEYTKRPKTYIAEIIFGVETDSYDLLGIPSFTGVKGAEFKDIFPRVREYIEAHRGKQMQNYPPYSSKALDTGTLPPPHEVELISYAILNTGDKKREDILFRTVSLTHIVQGDFRQASIREAWERLPEFLLLPAIEIELTVSGGFYIREFAHDIGGYLGIGACLYSLVRTKIQ